MKMLKRRVASLLILFCGYNQTVKAQQNNLMQNVTSFTPNSYQASLVNNVPINAYTGRLSLKVPLFEKKMSKLAYQVDLNYTGGGGLKRNDPGSSVGKGWYLNAVGSIIRNKRGVPDDYYNTRKDVYPTVPQWPNGLLFNTVQMHDDGNYNTGDRSSDIVRAEAGQTDTQHDIFEFNLLGRSGKFYIGKNWDIIMVPQSKLEIIPEVISITESGSRIGSFKVTDEQGIKYYFKALETTLESNPDSIYAYGNNYISAWYLTRVETAFNEESMNFEYIKLSESREKLRFNDVATTGQNPLVQSQSYAGWTTGLELKAVKFSDSSKIVFEYFNESELMVNPRGSTQSGYGYAPKESFVISKVHYVNSLSNTITTQKLNYIFWDTGATAVAPVKRATETFSSRQSVLKDRVYLESIAQLNSSGQALPRYAFDYYLGLSYHDDYFYRDEDIWGYHNGKNNTGALIDVSPWAQFSDRRIDTAYTKMGVLKQIYYPSGSSETFEYEPNDRRANNSNYRIGGIRLKRRVLRDATSGGSEQIREFKYTEPDGISSGFLGEEPVFTKSFQIPNGYQYQQAFSYSINPLSNIEGSPVGYRRVEEVLKTASANNGSIVYEFSDMSFVNSTLWSPADYYPYCPVDRPVWALGLPLRTSYYTTDGKLTKKVENSYHVTQESVVNDNFRSYQVGKLSYAGPYKLKNYYPVVGRSELIGTTDFTYPTEGITAPFKTTTAYSYDADTHLLKQIIRDKPNGEQIVECTYYPSDYHLGATSFTQKLQEQHILAWPIASETWISKAGNFFLIGSTANEYTNSGILALVRTYKGKFPHALKYSTKPGETSEVNFFNAAELLQSGRNMRLEVTYSDFDRKGRALTMQPYGGITSTMLLDKDGNTMAQAANADSSSIAYTSFEPNENLSNWSLSGSMVNNDSRTGKQSFIGTVMKTGLSSGNYKVGLWSKGTGAIQVNGQSQTVNASWSYYEFTFNQTGSVQVNSNSCVIDEITVHPVQGQLTSQTLIPGVGLASQTDSKRQSVFYAYDEFNRLTTTRDHHGDIIKHVEFKPKKVFLSAARSRTLDAFQCPYGSGNASSYTYQVPSGRYSSIISQEDADHKSLEDVNSLNANTAAYQNGNCVTQYKSSEITQIFTRERCSDNSYPLPYAYWVPAETYTSFVSQQDADAKAQADVANNGQLAAERDGTCVPLKEVTVYNNTGQTFEASLTGEIRFMSRVLTSVNLNFHIPQGTSTIKVPVFDFQYVSFNTTTEPLGQFNFECGLQQVNGSTDATFNNVNVGSHYNYTITINNH